MAIIVDEYMREGMPSGMLIEKYEETMSSASSSPVMITLSPLCRQVLIEPPPAPYTVYVVYYTGGVPRCIDPGLTVYFPLSGMRSS
jgi:hypothetical protein